MNFVNGSGRIMNTIHANNFSFFEEVNQVVQEEPSSAMETETLGLFAAIGIEKGRPFAPDARVKRILTEAAAVDNATARAITFDFRMKEAYLYPNSAWNTMVSIPRETYQFGRDVILRLYGPLEPSSTRPGGRVKSNW